MKTKAIVALAIALGFAMPAMGGVRGPSADADLKGGASCAMHNKSARNADTAYKPDSQNTTRDGRSRDGRTVK